jgi:hypothetical protein
VSETLEEGFRRPVQVEPAYPVVRADPEVIEAIDGELGQIGAVDTCYWMTLDLTCPAVEPVEIVADSQPKMTVAVPRDETYFIAAQAVGVPRIMPVGLEASGLRTKKKKACVGCQPEAPGWVLYNTLYRCSKTRQDHDSLFRRTAAAEVDEIIGLRLIEAETPLMSNPHSSLGVFEQAVD